MPRPSAALAALAAAALLALAAPLAAGHAEDAENHFTVKIEDLPAGESREIHASFEGGPLREGWVMILVGGLVNGTSLEGSLSLNGTVVHRWTWGVDGGRVHLESTALPETSEDYVITLRNPGPESERYFFYFDQSCDCYAKPLPFPGSYAIFNYDFLAGETAFLELGTEKPSQKLRYDVLVREGDGGDLAKDFRKVASYPDDALPNGTMTWKVDADRTYYFLAQGTQGEGMVTPKFYVTAPSSNDTPLAAGVAIAALGAAALALARSRGLRR